MKLIWVWSVIGLWACQSPGSTGGEQDMADVTGDVGDTSGSDGQGTDTAPDSSCSDECLPEGLAVCEGSDLKRCVRQGSGCLAFEVTACGASGCTNGSCGGACADECNAGELVCVGNGVAQCGQGDADSCRELLPAVACAQGTTCSNGVCSAQCQNECAQTGVATCQGTASYRACGQFDADNCLDLGATQNCASGTRCEGGTCVNDCTDECGVGARECSGVGFRTCGQFDADNCREWSTVTACAAGSECDTGNCVELCPGACTEGTRSCGNQGFRVCMGEDEVSCPELGLNVPCSAGNTCSNGQCAGACTIPRLSLAIDVSSSTVGAVNDAIRFGVRDFAEKAKHYTQIRSAGFPRSFGDSCQSETLSQWYTAATDLSGLAESLTASQVSSTPIAAALTSHNTFGDPRQGDAVVLITDGGETCGDADDVANAVRALRLRGLTVYALGLGAYDDTLLDRVVALGGGRLFAVSTAAEVTAALETIASELGATCPRGSFPTFETCTTQGTCATQCAAGSRPCTVGTGCCLDQVEACATLSPLDITVRRGQSVGPFFVELYEPGITGSNGTHSLSVSLRVSGGNPPYLDDFTATYLESVSNPFGDISNDRFTVSAFSTSLIAPGTYSFYFSASDPRYPLASARPCTSDWSYWSTSPPTELLGRLIITP